MADTLLLNADYRPHSLLSWREAIGLLVGGKARVEAVYDDWEVSSPSLTFKVPAVLVLLKYVVFRREVNFNRANIYARDGYSCQYCGRTAGRGQRLKISDLTFDHVIPRSKGGQTTWENIATACGACNTRKADRTPREAGMALLSKPRKPKAVNDVEFTLSSRSVPEAWRDYLYWTQELES